MVVTLIRTQIFPEHKLDGIGSCVPNTSYKQTIDHIDCLVRAVNCMRRLRVASDPPCKLLGPLIGNLERVDACMYNT
jgi:hypothetical protein